VAGEFGDIRPRQPSGGGADRCGRGFVDAYVEYSGDGRLDDVLDFYKYYRAFVQAKVQCFRAGLGTLYADQLFADFYASEGRPVEVAPWRLVLVLVMQYIEGLTNRQAADAVRRCMDWKYPLSLDLHDSGFDFTLLHDFRQRLLAHAAAQRLLDTFLAGCKARGWIKARGTNGRLPGTSSRLFARSTASNACWKPCIRPSTSSVRQTPPGCSSMCPWSGIPAQTQHQIDVIGPPFGSHSR
jgi:Transposase domain (DUF772)